MGTIPASPLGRILPRRVAAMVVDALSDTRVVLINGARQSGKSTLASQVAQGHGGEWRTLDHTVTRRAAVEDPTEFVESDRLLAIDEVQRAPELMLAIKESVDRDGRPGRFLLTGSARVLALNAVPDALPGRIETIELWPLSQGEIDGHPDGFVDAVFEYGPALRHESDEGRHGYAERVVRGGFPEAVARMSARRRERFFDGYVGDLINRDVLQVSRVEHVADLRALVKLLATRSGGLLVPSNLASELGAARETVVRHLRLLEEVFLVRRIPAWSRNVNARAVGTPKAVFVDSGVAANLLDADVQRLRRPEGPLGPLLEGFVQTELARQLTWSRQRVELFHYRTKDRVEVDAVLENRRGQVIGIEVKAAGTVGADDFRGLNSLAERVGDDFLAGIVLYTGGRTLPFGPRMRAMPISALWEVPAP